MIAQLRNIGSGVNYEAALHASSKFSYKKPEILSKRVRKNPDFLEKSVFSVPDLRKVRGNSGGMRSGSEATLEVGTSPHWRGCVTHSSRRFCLGTRSGKMREKCNFSASSKDEISFKEKRNNKGLAFTGFLNSRFFLWNLYKSESNPSLYQAAVVLLTTTTVRPMSIMAVPGANKEDKKVAAAKSVATGIISFVTALILYSPLEKAIKELGKEVNSKFPFKHGTAPYKAFNYLLNYGSGFIVAPIMAIALIKTIPKVMKYIFPDKKNKESLPANVLSEMNTFKHTFSSFVKGAGGERK